MLELVKEITQDSIVEAIRRMHEKSEKNYPSTALIVSEEKLNEIKNLPGYNSDTLYGKKVVNGEHGKIEGLIVVVSEEYKDKVYVADLPLNKEEYSSDVLYGKKIINGEYVADSPRNL